MSAIFALSEARRLLIISPALLNMRPNSVDVAGTHQNVGTICFYYSWNHYAEVKNI